MNNNVSRQRVTSQRASAQEAIYKKADIKKYGENVGPNTQKKDPSYVAALHALVLQV